MSKIMMPPMWLLLVEFEGGVNSYLCNTENAAWEQLTGYVERWWLREFDEERQEKITAKEIQEYFKRKEDESYTLQEVWEIYEEGDQTDEY